MTIGDMEVELRREGPQLRLHVGVRGFGVEAAVTREDVRRLTEHLMNAARRLEEEGRHES
jgi:hypothetical protein